jgi:hypothetical protein
MPTWPPGPRRAVRRAPSSPRSAGGQGTGAPRWWARLAHPTARGGLPRARQARLGFSPALRAPPALRTRRSRCDPRDGRHAGATRLPLARGRTPARGLILPTREGSPSAARASALGHPRQVSPDARVRRALPHVDAAEADRRARHVVGAAGAPVGVSWMRSLRIGANGYAPGAGVGRCRGPRERRAARVRRAAGAVPASRARARAGPARVGVLRSRADRPAGRRWAGRRSTAAPGSRAPAGPRRSTRP